MTTTTSLDILDALKFSTPINLHDSSTTFYEYILEFAETYTSAEGCLEFVLNLF